MPVTQTPMRYPGGKSRLYPVMSSLLACNDLSGGTWAEPFCGGAGLALALLIKGDVSRVVLADADPAVVSVWFACRDQPAELCRFVSEVPVTVSEWRRRREVWQRLSEPSFELACATLFLSRTNRAGILGARPTGGLSQDGPEGIASRFCREGVCRKIRAVASRADSVEVLWCGWAEFLGEVSPKLGKGSVTYLDPPYVGAGPGLYRRSLSTDEHERLAGTLRRMTTPWLLSVDDCGLTRELYRGFPQTDIGISYTATAKRRAAELLVAGGGVALEGLPAGRDCRLCKS